ncbi:hypothetical protein ABZX12_18670 [Kribbella sp. NPDC003505]|uniref:hypothetical protein n=1 Tax=Kribbella sp. NPDC003505 TaxID=3154448 RepID=UPI0033B65D16
MRGVAVIAAAVLLAAGCSSNDEGGPSPAPTSQPPVATAEPTANTPPAEETPGMSAAQVVQAFTKAKLPVRNARNNSANCDAQQLGCLELISTDDVTITTWGDAASMEVYAAAFGADVFVIRNVVLQYAAARTPATLRPRYQLALTRLAG